MAQVTNLGFDLLEQSQSQKEVTVNEALIVIDALLNSGVKDKDLSSPPSSPNNGDMYIVGTSATGDWTGKEGQIAWYYQAWRFIIPNEGFVIWVNDEDALYAYDGSSWVEAGGSGGGGTISTLPMLGINTSADSINKLAVASDAVLLNHNGTDIRVKLNKNADANTASFIFQKAFTGFAEFGLIADNSFTLKVSDGSNWFESFKVNKDNGNIDFKKDCYFNNPAKGQSYNVSNVPNASTYYGSIIFVSNGANGLPITAFSDGSNWLRTDTRQAISSS